MQHTLDGPDQKDIPDINQILQTKSVSAFFQQVVSVTRNTVCGLEGLVRGVGAEGLIAPNAMFDAAQRMGVSLALDRLCREKVLGDYLAVYPQHKDKLLFLNVDASVMGKASGYLERQVRESGLPNENIVIEINEAQVQGKKAFKPFIDSCRKAGFLIALDDVGAGFSNLDRIPVVKPDIIKIDTSLVRNIQSDYHRQGVFKSLITLAGQIGAMVVAEGVETEEEALEALKLGAHMIQGYYFSKPRRIAGIDDVFENHRIGALSARFKEYMSKSIYAALERHLEIFEIVRVALGELTSDPEFDERLTRIVSVHRVIERAYILDENGTQCSGTILNPGSVAKKNLIPFATGSGTDHSMKIYYYRLISEKLDRYITEPYVSPVTGNLCVTLSKPFSGYGNKKYILCMDFKNGSDPQAKAVSEP